MQKAYDDNSSNLKAKRTLPIIRAERREFKFHPESPISNFQNYGHDFLVLSEYVLKLAS